MIPLIIDDNVRMEIQRVKRNAEKFPISLKKMKKLMKGEGAPGGDDPKFKLLVPAMFKVVYTHETQPGNVLCRHLSMSIADPEKLPNPLAVQMMCEEFGFVNTKIDPQQPIPDKPGYLIWWKGKIGEGTLIAINVVEPLDGDYEKLKKKD